MDQDQQPGPSKPPGDKSPKGRRQKSAEKPTSATPKKARVTTPPLGTDANPIRVDSSSQDSVVCLDPAPRSPITESDESVVEIDPQAESTFSSQDGSDPQAPADLHPNRYSSSSEEEGWVSFRPTVKQAQKQMDYVQEPPSSDED